MHGPSLIRCRSLNLKQVRVFQHPRKVEKNSLQWCSLWSSTSTDKNLLKKLKINLDDNWQEGNKEASLFVSVAKIQELIFWWNPEFECKTVELWKCNVLKSQLVPVNCCEVINFHQIRGFLDILQFGSSFIIYLNWWVFCWDVVARNVSSIDTSQMRIILVSTVHSDLIWPSSMSTLHYVMLWQKRMTNVMPHADCYITTHIYWTLFEAASNQAREWKYIFALK